MSRDRQTPVPHPQSGHRAFPQVSTLFASFKLHRHVFFLIVHTKAIYNYLTIIRIVGNEKLHNLRIRDKEIDQKSRPRRRNAIRHGFRLIRSHKKVTAFWAESTGAHNVIISVPAIRFQRYHYQVIHIELWQRVNVRIRQYRINHQMHQPVAIHQHQTFNFVSIVSGMRRKLRW